MNVLEIKDFTQETYEDASKVIVAGFDEETARRTKRLLNNPLMSQFPSAGDIAYKNGVPVAFQAAIVRRLNIGGQRYHGVAGSTFCKVPRTGLKYVLAVYEKTDSPRYDCIMVFGNTAIAKTQCLASASGEEYGPTSCTKIRFKILRLGSFLRYASKGRFPRFVERLLNGLWRIRGKSSLLCWGQLQVEPLKMFWDEYLKTNKGLVLSRYYEDLNWLFGDRLVDGSSKCYVHQGVFGIDGYVIFNALAGTDGLRWYVADWVALRNDAQILDELLHQGLRSLARDTKAAFVECVGYPMSIQSVLRRNLNLSRGIDGNIVTYRFFDEELRKRFELVKDDSWFFGALDGDRILA